MDKTLQQIANTIVANLKNTEPIGLFNGKAGICLFLYRYARYSGSAVYEEIASELLEDVFKHLKPNMSPSIIDGLAGIGYVLSVLLKEHLVESDPEDNVLNDIDKILFNDARYSFMKELHFPIPLYSSGIYLLSRLEYDKTTVEQEWITNVISQASFALSDCIKQERYGMFKLSFLNSILYVFSKLLAILEADTLKLLLRDILYLSHQAIRQGYYRKIDIQLFQTIISQLPQTLDTELVQSRKSIKSLPISIPQNTIDFWYENVWWSVIYDTAIMEENFSDDVECYIDKKVEESYFDESTVNSNLAAVGLWLMNQI